MSSSKTMRAVVIREPGDPGVLELREVPRPEPGFGQIRVRVTHSGLNRADLLQRRGLYPPPPGGAGGSGSGPAREPGGPPVEIPGLEYAGVVDEVGPGVGSLEAGDRPLRPGDRVMGIVAAGGYAEFVLAHHRTVVSVPEPLSGEEAGAIPEVFMTAFDALFLQAGLAAGETLLVHAAGSGVGTAAIQLAWAAGVRCLGTSRTASKLEAAEALGLDRGILAGEDGWAQEVLEATGGRGVDVILDLVGGAYLAENLRVLAQGGRQIVVGVPSGARGEIDLRALMSRRAQIRGTVLRARPLEEKALLARAFTRRVLPLFESGDLVPVVDRVFDAGEASEAHRYLESNASFGKVLLAW